ncbi:hypothetical protein RHA1_ro00490 [Rhodococcus jostii RHA1]|uniref:Uncharacterized protein n=1 Tax=Rhodococcus jostii (strain RHA1) TaxID=101510 RepID=Q0SJG0_RHOJR|nr:hypothetical protein RHA1_ro00490 [Rhodococcus jostii RHA1]
MIVGAIETGCAAPRCGTRRGGSACIPTAAGFNQGATCTSRLSSQVSGVSGRGMPWRTLISVAIERLVDQPARGAVGRWPPNQAWRPARRHDHSRGSRHLLPAENPSRLSAPGRNLTRGAKE